MSAHNVIPFPAYRQQAAQAKRPVAVVVMFPAPSVAKKAWWKRVFRAKKKSAW